MRLLLASAYARLGLRTSAREQIEALPIVIQADPGVEALMRALRAMPDDLIQGGMLRTTLNRNLDVLRQRGITVDVDATGIDAGGKVQVFRTADGNVLRRCDGRWQRFVDDAGTARTFSLPSCAGGVQGPITLEGIDPPWLMKRLMELTPPRGDGYQPQINILQADEGEFLDALSLHDLTRELSQDRLRVFVGPGAGERFARELSQRSAMLIAGPSIDGGTQRERVVPRVTGIIDAAITAQATNLEVLAQRVREVYSGRDARYWAQRYRAAAMGRASGAEDGGGVESAGWGGPLRVLLPTTLHSTFVRHSAADLAWALRGDGLPGGSPDRAGHIERAEHRGLSPGLRSVPSGPGRADELHPGEPCGRHSRRGAVRLLESRMRCRTSTTRR